ncbi:unnamed protein product [Clavelina lepadiformis]|uniref:G-protein coupled receptors family 1 profile domain-containing protein n=1 Tax=Clavelina lepadiformis TaxID=159417 RepID=A0ABP0FH83_CLALP
MELLVLTLLSTFACGQVSVSYLRDCHYYQQNCPPGQFDCRCEDGEESVQTEECIPWSSVCDASRDCSNGADEVDCLCPAGMFQCSTCEQGGLEDCRSVFQCIDENLRCDFLTDCVTSKDEFDGHCIDDRGFDCGDGIFVSRDYLCDGLNDCPNGTDELSCPDCLLPHKPYACECYASNQCEGEGSCFGDMDICDGKADCIDGSDEHDCDSCSSPNSLHCACNQTGSCEGRRCYEEHLQCNGYADCVDGSDEWDCECPPWSPLRCACNQIGNYTCHGYGAKCYEEVEACDDAVECEDDSDETNCNICPEANPNPCACNQRGNQTCTELQCYPDRWKCDGYVNCEDGSDEWNCECPASRPLPCACNQGGKKVCSSYWWQCYTEEELCDGIESCSDESDEWNCDPCPQSRPLNCACNQHINNCHEAPCILETYRCDGYADCEDNSDELDCDLCTSERPNPCACNQMGNNTCLGGGWQCYKEIDKCNSFYDCDDDSDEVNCTCPADSFRCPCFHENFPTCPLSEGCFPTHYVNDGECDCDDCSDEQQIITTHRRKCGSCDVNIFWINDTSACISPWCDVTTCYRVLSLECLDYDCKHYQYLCTSSCSNDTITGDCTVLQCADRSPILGAQEFCNIRPDCADGSDEIIQDVGFKCSPTFSPNQCVLPQWNLYDDVAQCYDNSDLCFDEDGSFHCFRCLDNKLIIASRQACDGRIDCHDASDECLCENANVTTMCPQIFLDSNMLQCSDGINLVTETSSRNQVLSETKSMCAGMDCELPVESPVVTSCLNKNIQIQATRCDGRPECKDFSDECELCPNSPDFCSDDCASFYQLGDRYCDGEIDEAWIYLNRSDCPKGFDERNCPKRFKCPAGSKISIDVLQVCDGRADCNDRSDESNCPSRYKCEARGGFVSIPRTLVLDGQRDCLDGSDEFVPSIFSSPYNLIGNTNLERWYWVIAVVIIVGNAHVFILSVKQLKKKGISREAKSNHILILNLSVSDCLMGVYLFIILGKSVEYAGRYSEIDYEWRTSTICSIAGMISLISSETSCFVILILTTFRIYCVFWPFKAQTSSAKIWIVTVILAWVISILLAILPSNTLSYFSRGFIFISQFSSSDTVTKDFITSFACRLTLITNTTMDGDISDPQERVKSFLDTRFPQFAPLGEIGYYGTTSVCLPTFFAKPSDNFRIYSLVIITCNLVSFLSVCVGYIMIWRKSSNRPARSELAKKQSSNLQRRITMLIVTDMVCWIPICIMTYLSIGGVNLPPGIEIFTAGVLLPINSALNPLIYSPFVERYIKLLGEKLRSLPKVGRNNSGTELSEISRRGIST